MSHRCLTGVVKTSPQFYFKALQYGNYLWQRGHAGRAILSITRALYAKVGADSQILSEWPLPYAGLHWIVKSHTSDEFPGNPRVSFQHQATRLRGDRQELRRARAWAVWALIRDARPSLSGDLEDVVAEPGIDEIGALLAEFGNPREEDLWIAALSNSQA